MRPLLTSSVRRLWRDGETLQLGRPPGRAVVLAGVDPVLQSVLGLLDGTRDRDRLLADAGALGCPTSRTEQVLGLLDSADLLDDAAADRSALAPLGRADRDRLAPDFGSLRLVRGADGMESVRRRLAARVVVDGAGRVGAAVAVTLAAAGVGAVDVVDEGTARPEDCGVGGLPTEAIGRPRGEAARQLLPDRSRTAPTSSVALPDLLVIAPASGVALPEPPKLVAHLVAEVRGDVGIVGPFVSPGTSACLRCLDLTRTDRDPDWPALAVQLGEGSRGVAPCDGALALAVAAQTALQALAFLDGASLPATAGGTLELALPDWRWRRRSWQLHPDCGCGWRQPG
ncbi:MAG: TOMM precursor leader peptide-binding protein [Mycobacteriales bacterium]